MGGVDQAWCSGLSSAPGLLQRSVLSGYQRACGDELPSALLFGKRLFAIRGSLAFLPLKPSSPHIGRQMLPGYDACMYIYAPGGFVGTHEAKQLRGTVAVLFPGCITSTVVALVDRCVTVALVERCVTVALVERCVTVAFQPFVALSKKKKKYKNLLTGMISAL